MHCFPQVLSHGEADLILVVLSLIDMALVGGLLIIVMFSGYEIYVSRIDTDASAEKFSWLGKLDSGSLKQKVAASTVAISSIHLLKVFMNATRTDNDKIMWHVIIHDLHHFRERHGLGRSPQQTHRCLTKNIPHFIVPIRR